MSLSKIIGLAQVINSQGKYTVYVCYVGSSEAVYITVNKTPFLENEQDLYSLRTKTYDVPALQEADRYLTSLMNEKELQYGG